MRRLLVAAMCLAAGCRSSSDAPSSFVQGLRVLAVQAEPPQVNPGEVSQLSVLAFDTNGLAVDATWSRCVLPPRSGEAVNPGCVSGDTSAALEPLGAGLTIAVTMPQVTAAELGQPDVTNGVYVPFVANVTDGSDTITAVYRLRLGDGAPPNTNPVIASVDVIETATGPTPLDAAAPLVVHSGDALTLTATLAPASVESYTGIGGKPMTETLTISWFCTAGDLSVDKTSDQQPQTVLTLDQRLPETGENIEIFAVAHDERGGVGYTHRSLVLR
jgi:hypothetical protein